jgi:superfamily I DNA/RNA helicase
VRGLSMSTVRFGSRPRLHVFADAHDELDWLLQQLDPDDEELDATALLAPSNRMVELWRAQLGERGIGTVGLDEYRGEPVPGVKVGTYHRAKGLEFKRLFLPGLTDGYPFASADDPDEMVEKGSLLYVAMSRARDELDLSYSGRPSMFLEAVLPHVESVRHEQ